MLIGQGLHAGFSEREMKLSIFRGRDKDQCQQDRL